MKKELKGKKNSERKRAKWEEKKRDKRYRVEVWDDEEWR